MSFEKKLRQALEDVAPKELPSDAYRKLETLDRLLVQWSSKLDLIGFKTEEERIRRYFAEPLAASGALPRAGRALDIGSGGGSPGLPFAIARPRLWWTLLEPRLRRRLFLEEASRELGLENVRVSERRFGKGATGESLAAISTRGVRLSRPLLEAVVAALAPGGRFLWLGGADRLREAAEWLALHPGLSVEGPKLLLPGSKARLLLVVRVG